MSLVELLEQVTDRDSFVKFAEALAEERRSIERMEASEPDRYKYGGPEGWTNNSISLFIEGGLSHFDSDSYPANHTPSWRDLAEFLWCGKFME